MPARDFIPFAWVIVALIVFWFVIMRMTRK